MDVLGAVPDGVVMTDRHGTILHVNRLFEQLSGYGAGDLVGRPVETLVPASLRSMHETHRDEYSAAGFPVRPMGAGLDIKLERSDGFQLPVDIALSRVEVDGDVLVLASVRDITARRRVERRLRSLNEVAQSILAGVAPDALLHQVSSSAARLVDAELAVVVLPAEGDLEVRAAHGVRSDEVRSSLYAGAGGIAAEVLSTGSAEQAEDAASDPAWKPESTRLGPLGPALAVPLWVRGEPFACLLVAREPGQRAFEPADLDEEETFAAQAAVALEYARAREEVRRLSVLEDRERIARELHDTVIQRLFATGMGLQAAAPGDGSELSQRVLGAVDDLDEVIREIRSTIFALESAHRQRGLRARVLSEVQEWAGTLGFAPRVRFRGPLDAAVPDAMATQVLAALREALSNAVRHARASRVDVLLAADGDDVDELALEVEDDGVGFERTARRDGGLGLRNLEDRAAALGGSFEVETAPGAGTSVRWRVPLGP